MGRIDLTVALVPQKIKAGVDISPCDVNIFPILALELGLFFKISKKLLNVFWENIDPFDATGQFCDKGESYRSVAFYGNKTQKNHIEKDSRT